MSPQCKVQIIIVFKCYIIVENSYMIHTFALSIGSTGYLMWANKVFKLRMIEPSLGTAESFREDISQNG
jgi:hypothetical protein